MCPSETVRPAERYPGMETGRVRIERRTRHSTRINGGAPGRSSQRGGLCGSEDPGCPHACHQHDQPEVRRSGERRARTTEEGTFGAGAASFV